MTPTAAPVSTSRTSGPPAPARAGVRLEVVIFLAALLLRAGWGGYRLASAGDSARLEFPDEEQYWLMAGSFQAGQGLRDELGFRATRMPLYPVTLSIFARFDRGVIVAKVTHWLIGAAIAACVAGAATAIIDRRTGWVAGLLVACDPFLVFFSSLLLTETFYIAVIVVLWWIAWPILARTSGRAAVYRWALIGLVATIAVYVRESGLGIVGVLLGFVVICHRFDRGSLVGAGLAAGMVVAALVPWAARNRHVTGDWCWLTHRAGISLYDGVGQQANGSSNLGSIKQMPAVRGLTETEWNDYFLREAFRAIREDPGRIIGLAGPKLKRTWNPLPNVESYQSELVRLVSALWTIPTFALAVAGAVLLPRVRPADGLRLAVFLLLPAGYLSILHCFFVGSVRYRLVAVPMIEILASVAIVVLADRVRGRALTKELTGGD